MRKILGFTLVLTLVLGASFAYACGEKNTSAEATKADAKVTNANSACCAAGEAAVSTTASAQNAVAVAVEVIDSKTAACGVSAQKVDVTKASSESCAKGSDVKAQKASTETSGSCHMSGAKESAQKAATKAPEISKSKPSGMTSSATLTEEAGTLK